MAEFKSPELIYPKGVGAPRRTITSLHFLEVSTVYLETLPHWLVLFLLPLQLPLHHHHLFPVTRDSRHTANMGSVVLPHLVTGWHVDQAIVSYQFSPPQCMTQANIYAPRCPKKSAS